MKCKAVKREIEELEASVGPPVEVETHLRSCEACRAFSTERAALKALVGSLDKVSAPPDFDWRLRARLSEARSESRRERRWLPGFAPGAQAITVAASVTLILVAVVVYRQTRPAPSYKTQSAEFAATTIKEGAKSEDKAAPIINSAPVAAPNSAKQVGSKEVGRTREVKGVKANNTRTELARGPATQQQRIFTNDLGSRGADDLASAKNSYTDAGPVISVRVPSATASQLRFEDGQGTRRTLSPVNFGGQELFERPDKARLVPASEKGVW
ncbi:MAG: hypothetical protein ICV60_10735 [Pyrinomonadaceae bacterium]|nr:hypothetical protein [Pyrinomonadaceae bacterium]